MSENEVLNNEAFEINALLKILEEGEYNIIGCVSSEDYLENGQVSECEGFYILNKNDKILISKEPFTKNRDNIGDLYQP